VADPAVCRGGRLTDGGPGSRPHGALVIIPPSPGSRWRSWRRDRRDTERATQGRSPGVRGVPGKSGRGAQRRLRPPAGGGTDDAGQAKTSATTARPTRPPWSSRARDRSLPLRRRSRPGPRRATLRWGPPDGDSGWVALRPPTAPARDVVRGVNWRGSLVLFSTVPTHEAGRTRHFFTWEYQVDDPAHPPPTRGGTGRRSKRRRRVVGATVKASSAYGDRLELFYEAPDGPSRVRPRGRALRLAHQPRAKARRTDRQRRGCGIDGAMDPSCRLDRIAYLSRRLASRRNRVRAFRAASGDAGVAQGEASGAAPAASRLKGSGRPPRRSSSRRWPASSVLPPPARGGAPARRGGRRQPALTGAPPSCGRRCGATPHPSTGPTAAHHRREWPRAAVTSGTSTSSSRHSGTLKVAKGLSATASGNSSTCAPQRELAPSGS